MEVVRTEMNAQASPKYPYMTSKVNKLFASHLIMRYGNKNVVWPIVIIEADQNKFYIYEKNQNCEINNLDDNRPISKSNLCSYYIDYSQVNRQIIPANSAFIDAIKPNYRCSYDFTVNSQLYSSVDLDFAWNTGGAWKGIELTTLWMPLKNKTEAERLVAMLCRRPSWKGPNGPQAVRSIISAAADLNVQYFMVFVNSEKGVSDELVTEGNAYWFPLTEENLDRILKSQPPRDGQFGTFKSMIDWL